MKAIWLGVLLISALVLNGQAPHGSDDESVPEGERAACNNYAKTPKEHRCSCGAAMMCHGHLDDPEDETSGVTRCHHYCIKDKCRCIGPCETMRKVGNHG